MAGRFHDPTRSASPSAGRSAAKLLLLLFLLLPSLGKADVIYLKNGRKIAAQITREDDKQVFYEVNGGELSVPKSIIDHVEKGDLPVTAPLQSSTRPSREVPLPMAGPPEVAIEPGPG